MTMFFIGASHGFSRIRSVGGPAAAAERKGVAMSALAV